MNAIRDATNEYGTVVGESRAHWARERIGRGAGLGAKLKTGQERGRVNWNKNED